MTTGARKLVGTKRGIVSGADPFCSRDEKNYRWNTNTIENTEVRLLETVGVVARDCAPGDACAQIELGIEDEDDSDGLMECS